MKKYIGLAITMLGCCVLFNCAAMTSSNPTALQSIKYNKQEKQVSNNDYAAASEYIEKFATTNPKEATKKLQSLLALMDVNVCSFNYGDEFSKEGNKKKKFYIYFPKGAKQGTEKSAKKMPCLVFMHGGSALSPLGLDDPGMSIENIDAKDVTWTLLPMIAALLKKGIAVATITFAPLEKDNLPVWEQVKRQVELIKNDPNIDENEMFFIGHSFGGYALGQMLVNPDMTGFLQDNFKLGVGFEAPAGITKSWSGGAWSHDGVAYLGKFCYFGNEQMEELLSYRYIYGVRWDLLNKCDEICKAYGKNRSKLTLMVEAMVKYFKRCAEDSDVIVVEQKHCKLVSDIFSKIADRLQNTQEEAKIESLLKTIKDIIQKEKKYTDNMLKIRNKIQCPFEQEDIGREDFDQNYLNGDPIKLEDSSSRTEEKGKLVDANVAMNLESLIKEYNGWFGEVIKRQGLYYDQVKQLQIDNVKGINIPIYIFGATGDLNSTKRQYNALHKTLSEWLPEGTEMLKPIKEYHCSLHWIHRIRDKYVSGQELGWKDGLVKDNIAELTLGIRKRNFNEFIDDIGNIFIPNGNVNSQKQIIQKDVSETEKKVNNLIEQVQVAENGVFKDGVFDFCRYYEDIIPSDQSVESFSEKNETKGGL